MKTEIDEILDSRCNHLYDSETNRCIRCDKKVDEK